MKALSNQKYGDFVRLYGAENVGLLTGDNVINGDAPIVVMTTEVLRNMIYARSPALDRLRYAVLDEVHYLQDRSRGAVWEEVIIHLPTEVAIVALSATVSNAEELAAWMQTVRGETEAIIEERRPVELVQLYMVGERGADRLHLLPTFVEDNGELRPNPVAARLDGRGPVRGAKARRPRLYKPWRTEMVERLADEQMLPAIVFVFSRAGCDQAVEQCLDGGIRLTDSADRVALRRIADAHLENLADDDLEVLGYDSWLAGLEAGVAAHHAGMVPPMKEAVEEAFSAGLLKVVFATETLSLGINMPARSVVVEKLSKFTGEHHELLTPGEYTQLAGRAGRRGIDEVGYAIVLWDPFVAFEQVAGLASRRTYALTSSFRATYNMAANLVQRYERDEARRLLDLSFAQYHADRGRGGAHPASSNAPRSSSRAARDVGAPSRAATSRSTAPCSRRSTTRPRRARGPGEPARQAAARRRRHGAQARRTGGGAQAGARAVGEPRARAHPATHDGALDARRLPRARSAASPTVDLPRPFAPRSPSVPARRGQPAAPPARPRRRLRRGRRRARRSAAGPRIHAHPLHGASGTDVALRGAWQADRVAREVARLEHRIEGRTETLARQFDRVLAVLESWGYVERLGAPAQRPAARPAQHRRRSRRCGGAAHGPARRRRSCRAHRDRVVLRVPTPRPRQRLPDAAAPVAGTRRAPARRRDRTHLEGPQRDRARPAAARDPPARSRVHGRDARGPRGDDLAEILEDEEMTGGDFVRNVKQLIDLLRQIADVAPDAETAATARAAADACRRGVVAASEHRLGAPAVTQPAEPSPAQR